MKGMAVFGAIALVLAGCASAPRIRYYTLDMTPSGQAQTPANIVVERIRVGEALARKDLLIKKQPIEVEYYANAQWVSNLDELLLQKLRAEFGPKRAGAPEAAISGELLAFEQVDAAAGAEAHVRLSVECPAEAWERTYDVRQQVGQATPAAIVSALSKCVESIAASISADIAAR